jgi:hypothetical protein
MISPEIPRGTRRAIAVADHLQELGQMEAKVVAAVLSRKMLAVGLPVG